MASLIVLKESSQASFASPRALLDWSSPVEVGDDEQKGEEQGGKNGAEPEGSAGKETKGGGEEGADAQDPPQGRLPDVFSEKGPKPQERYSQRQAETEWSGRLGKGTAVQEIPQDVGVGFDAVHVVAVLGEGRQHARFQPRGRHSHQDDAVLEEVVGIPAIQNIGEGKTGEGSGRAVIVDPAAVHLDDPGLRPGVPAGAARFFAGQGHSGEGFVEDRGEGGQFLPPGVEGVIDPADDAVDILLQVDMARPAGGKGNDRVGHVQRPDDVDRQDDPAVPADGPGEEGIILRGFGHEDVQTHNTCLLEALQEAGVVVPA